MAAGGGRAVDREAASRSLADSLAIAADRLRGVGVVAERAAADIRELLGVDRDGARHVEGVADLGATLAARAAELGRQADSAAELLRRASAGLAADDPADEPKRAAGGRGVR